MRKRGSYEKIKVPGLLVLRIANKREPFVAHEGLLYTKTKSTVALPIA